MPRLQRKPEMGAAGRAAFLRSKRYFLGGVYLCNGMP